MSALFAILSVQEDPIRLLSVDSNTITDVIEQGECAAHEMFFGAGKERLDEVPYDGKWKVNNHDSVIRISEYGDNYGLLNIVQHPENIKQIDDSELKFVKSIFFASEKESNTIYIQNIDQRSLIMPRNKHLLTRKVGVNGDFCANTGFNGIYYGSVHAVLKDNTLYFSSFTMAHRALDLSLYLLEATKEQLLAFYNHKSIKIKDCDQKTFVENASRPIKRLIFLILNDCILDQYTPCLLHKKASENGIYLELDESGKIVIPTKDPQKQTEVLNFLNNSIFRSLLDEELYQANSFRKLPH